MDLSLFSNHQSYIKMIQHLNHYYNFRYKPLRILCIKHQDKSIYLI